MRPCRILLASDQESTITSLTTFLDSETARAHPIAYALAVNPPDTARRLVCGHLAELHAALQSPGDFGWPDLLLLDALWLAESNGGTTELLAQIRNDYGDYGRLLPVLVLTMAERLEDRVALEGAEELADDYLLQSWLAGRAEGQRRVLHILDRHFVTVNRYLVDCLAAQGVKTVYGMPGGEVLGIVHAIVESAAAPLGDQVRFILTAHEQGAAFMADGAGRVNSYRVPGVCLSTLGPGATNLVTGVVNAWEDKAAMVVITGQVATGRMGRESHQAEETLRLFDAFTKHHYRLESTDADTIASAVSVAFSRARTENAGPVVIEVPLDLGKQPLRGYTPPLEWLPQPVRTGQEMLRRDPELLPAAAPEDIRSAAELIRQALRPLLLIGPGANRAAQNEGVQTISGYLRALLDKWRLPATTTFMGKGAIDPQHDLRLPVAGCFQGVNTCDLYNVAMDAADLVVTVGYGFHEFEAEVWNSIREQPARLVNISFTAPQIERWYDPEVSLLGSISANLRALAGELGRHGRGRNAALPCHRNRWGELANYLRGLHDAEAEFSREGPLTPQALLGVLWEHLQGTNDQPDGIVISDVGFHKLCLARYYPARRPNTCLIPNGFSPMGYALPAAIGVKMERPDRQVVAVAGDGGLLINCQELVTVGRTRPDLINEQGLGLVVILWRNDSLGLIEKKNQQAWARPLPEALDLSQRVHYAELARACGMTGYAELGTVEQFSSTLAEALGAAKGGQSSLLEAIVQDQGPLTKHARRLGREGRRELRDHVISQVGATGEEVETWEQVLAAHLSPTTPTAAADAG